MPLALIVNPKKISWMIKRLHFFILIYNLFLVTLSILIAMLDMF